MENSNINILLVEDDTHLGPLLEEYLKAKNFKVQLAKDGKKGYDLFCKYSFDLLILDVMMPIKDGITLAKEIRLTNKQVPIIFLTAKSMKEDKMEGFEAGADDYMTKPFSMEELLARITAIMRRTNKQKTLDNTETQFKIGNYKFNTETQVLEINKNTHKLTTKESELLRLLCVYKNDILDRAFTLKTIWNDDNYFNSRSMDVYIAKLRKCLTEDKSIDIINVHGKGFKLIENK